MDIYAVKYENYMDSMDSWVDTDVYKSQEAANRTAEQAAKNTVDELNAEGEGYRVEIQEAADGGLYYTIVNADGAELEAFVVVQ